jgi:outer membrane protein assembly factor BamA
MKIKNIGIVVSLAVAVGGWESCSSGRFVPGDEYLLHKVTVRSSDKAVSTENLDKYVRQRPNTRWLGFMRVPLGIYCLQGKDTTRAVNRFLRRVGEAPVIYSAERTRIAEEEMLNVAKGLGFLHARISTDTLAHGRKLDLAYNLTAGERYTLGSLDYQTEDSLLYTHLQTCMQDTYLHTGNTLRIDSINEERSRITHYLQNHGYQKFNKDFITLIADTLAGSSVVDLTFYISEYRKSSGDAPRPHTIYNINKVYVYSDVENNADTRPTDVDTTHVDSMLLLTHGTPVFRESLYKTNIPFRPGDTYRENDVQDFYNRWSRYGAVKYTTVRMQDVPTDTTSLDCYVSIYSAKKRTLSAELEGTNSAGDLGAAAVLSLSNRNLFKGSEQLTFKGRAAYEAIRGLEGYSDQDYLEFTLEANLTFPSFAFPYLGRYIKPYYQPHTEFAVLYTTQTRPEYHRRALTGRWGYLWKAHQQKIQHKIELLDVNYVLMPWISDTFRQDYLENSSSRNSLLRYNYENLFVIKSGYSYTYNTNGFNSPYAISKSHRTFRFNVESAGSLLYGITSLFNMEKNSDGRYTLFGIPYAQYVKCDVDYAYALALTPKSSVAFRAALGVAYPYGNATILPYETRYFSGGANSVRGWSVRELGPGRYKGTDGRIDFINQTGDISLNLSMEYRTFIGWKLHGALFVDAGNIWTLREYEDQPGGQFRWDTFYEQIAVAYGAGLRFNFDYFILRLDAGMKAVDPAYPSGSAHYPVFHPKFSRDFTFHFAVGMPF